MSASEATRSRGQPSGRAVAAAAAAVLGPLALLAVLRLRPSLDVIWENQQAHFWIVLAAAAVTMGLGYSVTVATGRRRDARLFVLSRAFLVGAEFLGLHTLASSSATQ